MIKKLFLEVANPDEFHFSRWVHTSEFIGSYAELNFLNGCSWGRKSSALAKQYIVELGF